MPPANPAPVIFLSYSHDSAEHRAWVLSLSERLRADGYDTRLDQYQPGSPPNGWPRWMGAQLKEAHYVLLVCTKVYYDRFHGQGPVEQGRGVDWEGALISKELYKARNRGQKFIAVLRQSADEAWIPEILQGLTHYVLDSRQSYDELRRVLDGTAGVVAGPVGTREPLHAREGTVLTFPDDSGSSRDLPDSTTRKVGASRATDHRRSGNRSHAGSNQTKRLALAVSGVAALALAAWLLYPKPDHGSTVREAMLLDGQCEFDRALEAYVRADAKAVVAKRTLRLQISPNTFDGEPIVSGACSWLDPSGRRRCSAKRLPEVIEHAPVDVSCGLVVEWPGLWTAWSEPGGKRPLWTREFPAFRPRAPLPILRLDAPLRNPPSGLRALPCPSGYQGFCYRVGQTGTLRFAEPGCAPQSVQVEAGRAFPPVPCLAPLPPKPERDAGGARPTSCKSPSYFYILDRRRVVARNLAECRAAFSEAARAFGSKAVGGCQPCD